MADGTPNDAQERVIALLTQDLGSEDRAYAALNRLLALPVDQRMGAMGMEQVVIDDKRMTFFGASTWAETSEVDRERLR